MPSYDITLVLKDGREHHLEVADDETVLEAARRTDVILPAGCLTGTCGTCAGLLLEAEGLGPSDDPEQAFEYRRPPSAIGPSHRRQGYVLLCSAEPRTDCRLAVAAATRSHRSEAPWT